MRVAAAPAGAPGAAVDVAERPRAVDARTHQPRGRVERRAQLVVRDVAERAPRRDARLPERLRLPHVPDAGDERAGRGARRRPRGRAARRAAARASPSTSAAARGCRARGGRAAAVARELEHRPVPEHRLVLVAAEDEPGQPGPARTAPLDAPAAGHAQVAAEDEPALEAKQEVLPDRLHRLEPAPVEPLDETLPRGPRVRRLDLDPLPGEHLQPPRGALERVTLWHSGA